MPTYIILVSLTDEGKANFKEMYTKVREEVKASIEGMGGKIRGWLTLGPYDAVELVDLPNDDALLNWTLGSAGSTYIRTVTMRAFPEDEVKKALG